MQQIALDLDENTTKIMKGMAIMCIILTHMPFDLPVFSLRGIGAWGVGVFLFLSGFGLESSYQKTRTHKLYWQKRFLNTYLPFLIVMVLHSMLNLATKNYGLSKKLLLSIVGLYPDNLFDGSMWYITYIFLWYTAYYLTIRVGSIEKQIERVIYLFGLGIIIDCVAKFPSFQNGSADIYTWLFPLGMLFAIKDNQRQFHKCCGVFGVMLFLLVWTTLQHEGMIQRFYSILTVMATLSIWFFAEAIKKTRVGRGIGWIGKKSYYYFLCEYSIIQWEKEYFGDWFWGGNSLCISSLLCL